MHRALLCLFCACFSLRAVEDETTPGQMPPPENCGNGKRDMDELCDGDDLPGVRACLIRGMGAGGGLTCSNVCDVDRTDCVAPGDPRLLLWLSASTEDTANTVVDRAASRTLAVERDGVLASETSSSTLAFSPQIAFTPDPADERQRAYDFGAAPAHTVFTLPTLAGTGPLTYELWLRPTDVTPWDRARVVLLHENVCTIWMVPAATDREFRVRATCGTATLGHPRVITATAYALVTLVVSPAGLVLSVDGAVARLDQATNLGASGRFAFGNSLDAAAGNLDQFIGLVDEVRIFAEARSDKNLCFDAGKTDCR